MTTIRYTVEGTWPFPLDMLRHDRACAVTAEDEAKINRLSGENAPDRQAISTKVSINLITERERKGSGPNAARWDSFGWLMTACDGGAPSPAQIITIARPTVHLNGTSRDELKRQYLDAYRAVDAAIDAVQRACPNGRDYYVQPVGAFQTAQGEHQRRLERLEGVKRELSLIVDGLWELSAGRNK